MDQAPQGARLLKSAAPLSVLIVDDDPFVRRTLARQLDSLGVARCVEAADGAQADRALRDHGPFDLLLSDLLMPDTDGIELLRGVQQRQPALPVVLISSLDQSVLNTARDVARARNIHLLGVLQKPATTEALRLLLSHVRCRTLPLALSTTSVALDAEQLRQAINAEEIDIVVQPQVDARSRHLVGVEALARWVSTRHGIIAPLDFVPTAERAGLMDVMTALVLRKAMAACAQWRQQGLETRMSVNFAADTLDNIRLPEQLSALCQDFGLDARHLQLEITESRVLPDGAAALDVLARLRMRGFDLAIDDFGTGHSSLTQLKRIPFTELKIDKSFVGDAVNDPSSRRIFAYSAGLAQSLGLRTVAEGVETEAEWALADALGCSVIQGYRCAKPMPLNQFPRWAAAQRQR